MATLDLEELTENTKLRAILGAVTAPGIFCFCYHLLFYLFWRLLFGEEVWPWPQWSRILLLVAALAGGGAAAAFVAFAHLEGRRLYGAALLVLVSIYSLFAYTLEVKDCLFRLGFAP